jgi:acyl-homoserine lactone acylase PvdQ
MKYYFSLIVFLFLSCATAPLTEQERQAKHVAATTIIRDSYGVPHIYGETDADAVFGLLFAQCEDDFARLEDNYILAIGRLAEVEGEAAIYSDLRAKLFMTTEQAQERYQAAPEHIKTLCVAFADAVNYYLEIYPGVQPKLLTHFEPWMPMYFSEGSIGGDIERISTKKIAAFYENGAALPTEELLAIARAQEAAEPAGSNGIAISGKRTKSGAALLLINPHTSFFFRGEVHVNSKEGLNAYGAVTWGQFFVYQGFNEKTGWMHTSTYTDVMDEYLETIFKKGDSLYYRYGTEERLVKTDTVSLAYKDEKGILQQKAFPTYRTHHGPITHMEDDQWVASAMMWDPVTALEQSYSRTKQSNYKGFKGMMDLRTNSSNNTVYADAEGNIAYFHGNFVPKRDSRFDFTKAVNGSDPATDWQGLHTVDENILILNPANGWLQNCNSTPFTAALQYSPKKEHYPVYMSIDQENFRGVHAISLLSKMEPLDLDGLITLAHDPFLPAFEVLIPGLVKAYDATSEPDIELKAAIEVLRTWDFTSSKDAVGMSLAHFYGTHYGATGEKPTKETQLSDMELMTYFGNESPDMEKLQVFKETLAQMNKDFGTWNTPWGDINRYQRLNGDSRQAFNDSLPSIPIGMASGRWGALAAFGARYTNNTKKIYGTRGNSFVAVVSFGEKLEAKSILAGGQSGYPSSPHFSDQAQPYADQQFKKVLFYKEEVLKDAQKSYHPGE